MVINPVAGKIMSGRNLTLNIIFRKVEDGTVVAECLEIPGCLSQGETEEEAKKNIWDAIQQCISVILEDAIEKQCGEVPNLVGIDRQEKLTIRPNILELEESLA